jgi:cupin superfamily acireductone dioxygenase involved in methionine salvage
MEITILSRYLIEGGGGFVEQKKGGTLEQRSRDGDLLSLPAG